MADNITYEEAVELFEILQGSGNYDKWASAANKWGADTGRDGVLQWIDEHYGTTTYKEYYTKPSVAGEVFEPMKDANNLTKGYSVTWSGAPRQPSIVDSNYGSSFSPRTPINTTATVVAEKDVMSFKVGLREAGNFLVKSVGSAVVATAGGITLGKTIDSTLYDLAPDFWDAHNMSTLDPATWNTITTDYDGVAGTLFDVIFGVNEDGTTQAYINEDALAYTAWYMNHEGAFMDGIIEAEYEGSHASDITAWQQPIKLMSTDAVYKLTSKDGIHDYYREVYYTNTEYLIPIKNTDGNIEIWALNKNSAPVCHYRSDPNGNWYTTSNAVTFRTLDSGITVYLNRYIHLTEAFGTPAMQGLPETIMLERSGDPSIEEQIVTIIYDGTVTREGIPGIGTQDGAITPNTTGWTDLPSVRQSLQQQYPELWDNAKHQDYVDENGNNRSTTLIPINFPNTLSPFDPFPTSGERTQDEPLIDPTTATKDLIDTITKLITGEPPINPPTTGSGDGPTVIAPVGTASSLWAIYNPTQNQLNSFGSWLWDSSFVEQIKKLFNDPMQAIIGVHKVFATPSIGGTATIKVGYLDSQVPSDYVDSQYTTVDCGTVNLYEYFGNVFDYSPYTRVSLYLPFIGIVDLDVADVMRASINVKYHVDVLSGACLADVKVTRDLGSAILYQYSGSAIVTYPVSSGNYMGMVAGVLSVAGGVLGTIASGGALAPALIGGAVGASHLHTNVSHSGGFSGCAGAMGGKKPYIIISRPQTAMAGNYGHFTGKPANTHVTLKNCGGMTRVKSVYVGNMNATDEEKDIIEAQLKRGVLI